MWDSFFFFLTSKVTPPPLRSEDLFFSYILKPGNIIFFSSCRFVSSRHTISALYLISQFVKSRSLVEFKEIDLPLEDSQGFKVHHFLLDLPYQLYHCRLQRRGDRLPFLYLLAIFDLFGCEVLFSLC